MAKVTVSITSVLVEKRIIEFQLREGTYRAPQAPPELEETNFSEIEARVLAFIESQGGGR